MVLAQKPGLSHVLSRGTSIQRLWLSSSAQGTSTKPTRDLCHTKSKREAAVSELVRRTLFVRTLAWIVRVSEVSVQFSRSNRVPFSQRLFFRVRGINTPLTPSLTLSLAHFKPDQVLTLKQALSLPPFDSWEISWGVQMSDLQEKRFELVSIHSNPWELVLRRARGFKSFTLGALSS